MKDPDTPVFGVVGWSGVGKTTLIEKLIAYFSASGLRVSVIKHTHHAFDIDRPGKDSWRHREAGAHQVLLASEQRWVLIQELRGVPEPDLATQCGRLAPCDLILIEGFRAMAVPKIEVWQADHGEACTRPLFCAGDDNVVALAADSLERVPPSCRVPRLDLNDVPSIAQTIAAVCRL